MVNEPELAIRFQYKMSLKREAGTGMLRVNDHHHAESRAVDAGRDEGVHCSQSEGSFRSSGARGDVRLRGASAAGTAISETEQRTEGHRAAVPSEDHGEIGRASCRERV